MILGLALEKIDFALQVCEELRETDFDHPLARKIAVQIMQRAPGAEAVLTVNDLMVFFREEPGVVTLLSQVSADVEILADKEKVFVDCLVQMKRQRIRAERGELLSQIATAERIGDQGRINEFMGHLHELNKREKKINEKK